MVIPLSYVSGALNKEHSTSEEKCCSVTQKIL